MSADPAVDAPTSPAPRSTPRLDEVAAYLRDLGADRIAHPGGNLLDHLCRTAEVLQAWDGSAELVLAGLCHAVYGTDGFPAPLVGPDRRHEVAERIGRGTERIVYLYGSCDRGHLLRPTVDGEPSVLRDRFTGRTVVPDRGELRAFLELTAANEYDLIVHHPGFAAEHGPEVARHLARERAWLSKAAVAAYAERYPDAGWGRR